MAEQMLKQAGLSPLQSKDLLDLRRINNQPIDSESDSPSRLENHLPFTPMAATQPISTSTPLIPLPYNSDDDRFQIRNMQDMDSDDGEMEEESYSNNNSHVHEHGYTKRLPAETLADESLSCDKDKESETMEEEKPITTDNPEVHSDTETASGDRDSEAHVILDMEGNKSDLEDTDSAISESQASGGDDDNDDEIKTKSDIKEKTDGKSEVLSTDEKVDMNTDAIIRTEDNDSENKNLQPGSPGAAEDKSGEVSKMKDVENRPASETSDNLTKNTSKANESDKPQESHEMECQTETMSDNESSEDGDKKATKAESGETPVKVKEEPSELEDTTLTMLCESITKETFGNTCEEENDADDHDEDEDDDDDYEEELKRPAKRRKKNPRSSLEWKDEYGSSKDLDGDPELLKMPFLKGWKRELVIRGVFEEYSKSGQPKKKPADVYYFAPEGVKLRSKVMIANHLQETGSDLTQANFSFIRRPIYKPPFECVRQAGKSKGRAAGRKSLSTTFSPSKGKGHSPKHSPGNHSRKRKRGRPKKYTVTTTAFSAPLQQPTTYKEILVLPPSNIPPPEVVLEREGEEEPYEKGATQSAPSPIPPPPSSATPPLPPVAPPKKTKPTARKSTCQAAKRNNQPSYTAVKKVPAPPTVDQLCGLDCPGLGGKPPDLTCGLCMCLFHPECVNILNANRPAVFVCRRCIKAKGQPATSSIKTIMTTPLSSPNWTSVTMNSSMNGGLLVKNSNAKLTVVPRTSVSAAMPALRNCLNSSAPIPTGIVSNRGDSPSAIKTFLIPVPPGENPIPGSVPIINAGSVPLIGQVAPVAVTSPKVLNMNMNNPPVSQSQPPPSTPLAGAVTGNLPKLIPAPVPKAPSSAASSIGVDPPQPPQLFKNGISVFNVTKPPASSLVTTASKESVISVSNARVMTSSLKEPNRIGGDVRDMQEGDGSTTPAQLLTLPAAVVSRLNLSQPLALKINNKQIVAPPSCFIKSRNGEVKVCLPANTVPLLASGSSPLNMQVKVSEDNNQENGLKFVGVESGSPRASNKTERTLSASSSSKKPLSSKRRLSLCQFRILWSGFEALQQIFTHLPVRDLLRAGCVCKTWNRIVKQMSLWQHLNMEDICVKQWPSAVKFLDKVRTESLDFRGCDSLPLEKDMFPVLGELSLKCLYLGEVTPSFLDQVGEHLTSLTHLSAEAVGPSGSSINFAKLSRLGRLKELRLCHSSKGSDKTTDNTTNKVTAIDLEELSALKQLEILVLTGFTGMKENDWRFLKGITKIRELELSDCSSWKNSVYQSLGQCKELEVLKLGHGGTFSDTAMANALANLTKLKHLELKKWIIAYTIQDVLPELDFLHTLIFTPDTTTKAAVINRNTLSAVWDLSRLQTLKWGIHHSRDATIILNDGGSDDAATSGGQQKQATQCIPFLADDVSSDHLEQVDIDQMTQFISIEQLREKLHSLLPETDIEVYLLTNKSSNRVGQTGGVKLNCENASEQISNGVVVKSEPVYDESPMETDGDYGQTPLAPVVQS